MVKSRKKKKASLSFCYTCSFLSVILLGCCVYFNLIKQGTTKSNGEQSLEKQFLQSLPLQEIDTRSEKETQDLVAFCHTTVPIAAGFEPLLKSLVGIIFREEGLLSTKGSVLDVGAQFGENACKYAVLAPHRTVYALDPSPTNTKFMKEKFQVKLPNLKVLTMGIGKQEGIEKIHNRGDANSKGNDKYHIQSTDVESFEVTTIDSMFYNKGEKLAFAHIDVEGVELDVLKGGSKTINRDRPLFTIELTVHENVTYTQEIVNYIYDLGYEPYLINEVCGFPRMDFRNVLCIPRENNRYLITSDLFNLLAATNAIIRINADSIFEWVYPCCKLGEECCPINDSSCCHQNIVQKWLGEKNVVHPLPQSVQLTTFTYARQNTQKLWWRLVDRIGMSNQKAKESGHLWLNNPEALSCVTKFKEESISL